MNTTTDISPCREALRKNLVIAGGASSLDAVARQLAALIVHGSLSAIRA